MINICYTKRELNYIFINHCQKAILDIKYIQLGSDSIKTKNKIVFSLLFFCCLKFNKLKIVHFCLFKFFNLKTTLRINYNV